MKSGVGPKMHGAKPRACFQQRGVLNDEERSRIEPHEREESSDSAQKAESRRRGRWLRSRLLERTCCDRHTDQAERGGRDRLTLRSGREETRDIAEEVTEARADAHFENRVPVAGKRAEMRDERDGEETKRGSNQECDGSGPEESEGKNAEKSGRRTNGERRCAAGTRAMESAQGAGQAG